MKFDREKFIDETCGNLDEAFEIIDNILSTLDHYIASDECSNGYGGGCFTEPQNEIERCFRDNGVHGYIIYT